MEDPDQNKLFVGGISWETTEDVLKDHFNKYGNVAGCVIAKDRITGSPRGFAFVSFSDPAPVDQALSDTHEILSRTVEVKKAIPRSEQHQSQQQQNRGLSRNSRSSGRSNDYFRTKKIFVGGLSANLTEEEFKGYFETFGRITDVVVMHDNVTHRPRGFGFITFESEDSVEKVMQKNFHELCGKLVEVKRAIPKDGNANSNMYNTRGGGGGGGGGRGSNVNSYQNPSYGPYTTRYGLLPGYGPLSGYGGASGYPYGAGIFGGGYPSIGYGGIGFGVPPLAPRGPWNSPAMLGIRGSPLPPFGAAPTMYPPYLNGMVGSMGAAANGYNGSVGAWLNDSRDSLGPADSMSAPVGRGDVDVNTLSPSGSFAAAGGKQNKNGNDERFKAYTAGKSS